MGLFGKYKERCEICMKEFKVEEEHKHHTETLHPLEKQCIKCAGTMRIPKKPIVPRMKKGWTLSTFDLESAIAYTCENCGYMELYMWDPTQEFYRSKTATQQPKEESKSVICKNCGDALKPESKYCGNCGTQHLENENTTNKENDFRV